MTTDTIGGVWTYSLELSRALASHGTDVILATMGAPLRQGQRIEAAGVPNVQLMESRYQLEWMEDPWSDVEAAGTWLEMLEAQFAPDLIHLNGYAHAALPWSAPVVVVAHSDVVTWWEAVHGETPPASWNRYREVVRRGLNAADRVVVPTHSMLREMQRHYGPLANACVVHNARGAGRFSAREKEAFILCAGRLWDKAKNVRVLADIAADLGWSVKVAGEAVAPKGRKVELRNVELLGQRGPGEMSDLFARASVYALPARYEPFGLTVLEAALAGCALVLGDIPTLRELWSDAAEFVPPDDRDALQHALSRIITQPERRAELAQRASQRAARFTIESMVRGYLAAYADAAHSPHVTEPESAPSPA
jgi:glycosyltransferase involved in cell wall biosynthesis